MPSFSLQANLSCLLLHLVGRRRQEVEARLAHGRRVHHRQGTWMFPILISIELLLLLRSYQRGHSQEAQDSTVI